MANSSSSFWDKLLKNKKGDVVIYQPPNLLLYGWFFSRLASYLIESQDIKTGLETLSNAFLFTWAYLEASQGVNYLRRILGFVILIALTAGFFIPRI